MPALSEETVATEVPSHVLMVTGGNVRRSAWAVFKEWGAASLALTGTPTAPTADPATNTTQVATTAYADAAAAAVVPSTASQIEMEAGTETAVRKMSPKLVADAIAALATGGSGAFADITGDWFDNTSLGSLYEDLVAYASPYAPPANDYTLGGSHVLALVDAKRLLRLTPFGGGSQSLTVPPNADVAFAVGDKIWLRQVAAGTITLVAGSGVTINSLNGVLTLPGTWGTGVLEKTDTNAWTYAVTSAVPGLAASGGAMTGQLLINLGTITDSNPGWKVQQTWNDAAEAFVASEWDITNTASLGATVGDSYFARVKLGGTVVGGLLKYYNSVAFRGGSVQLGSRYNGIFEQSSSSWNLVANDVIAAAMWSNQFRLAAATALAWKGDNAPYSGSADTKMARVSAGLLKIVDGSDVLAGLQLGTASSSLQVGTHASIAAETVTGYITIKDSAGTDRKVAVVS